MTAYVTIPNTDVDQDSPVTVALMTALRDNPTAITEGSSGSPVLGLTKLAVASISNVASVDFTAFDATRYNSYMFVHSNVVPATNAAEYNMRTSTDGGSTFDTGTNYLESVVTNITLFSGTGTASTSMRLATDVANTAAIGVSGITDLYAPDETDQTITSGRYGVRSSSGGMRTCISAGLHITAADVDAVRFLFSTGNMSTGEIIMYGRSV